MDFSWSARQTALRVKFLRLGEEIASEIPRGDSLDFYPEVWHLLEASDLWRILVPQEFGGHGSSWWDFAAAFEGLTEGARSSSLMLSVIAQMTVIHALLRHGTEAQKKRYFPRLLKGDCCAVAIADPLSGTDVRHIQTTVSLDGNGFRLNGSKWNIVHGPNAEFALVVARFKGASDQQPIGLVFVEKGMEGLELSQPDVKLGNRPCPTGAMHFRNTPLSSLHILGNPQDGFKNLIEITSMGRAFYALLAGSMLRPFLAEAMAYAIARESFQSKLSDHQYVQGRLTEVKMHIERSCWLAYAALWQLEHNHEEAFLMCSISKLAGSEALIKSGEHLLRLYGSNGYQDGVIADLMRDALGFCSIGGTEEMHRKNIFNQLQRLMAKPRLHELAA